MACPNHRQFCGPEALVGGGCARPLTLNSIRRLHAAHQRPTSPAKDRAVRPLSGFGSGTDPGERSLSVASVFRLRMAVYLRRHARVRRVPKRGIQVSSVAACASSFSSCALLCLVPGVGFVLGCSVFLWQSMLQTQHHGTAPAGGTLTVPLKLSGPAAAGQVAVLTVNVSYDDGGRTWTKRAERCPFGIRYCPPPKARRSSP